MVNQVRGLGGLGGLEVHEVAEVACIVQPDGGVKRGEAGCQRRTAHRHALAL